jgi:hypothetical protein
MVQQAPASNSSFPPMLALLAGVQTPHHQLPHPVLPVCLQLQFTVITL